MSWECPRCGRINAYWVMTCQCPPPVVVTTTTNLGRARGDQDIWMLGPKKEP